MGSRTNLPQDDPSPAMHGANKAILSPSATVLDKLTALEATRREQSKLRQDEARDRADPGESVEGYLAWFGRKAASAAAECSRLQDQAASGSLDEGARNEALRQAHALIAVITSLEAATADASYFLPGYDQRSCSATIQDLRARAEAAAAVLAPPRMFSFASKRVNRVRAAEGAMSAACSTVVTPGTIGVGIVHQPGPATAPTMASAVLGARPGVSGHDLALIEAGRGLKGLHGAAVVRHAAELAGREFVLADLSRCAVFLLGPMAALRMQGLEECSIYAGPVDGAVFASHVQGCTLMLAAQQVRLHSSTSCDVYLHVRSRPIIEHCERLRFAPLDAAGLQALAGILPPEPQPCVVAPETSADTPATAEPQPLHAEHWQGSGIAKDHKALAEETGRQMWAEVEDFGWIKATASPHWQILRQADRALFPRPPSAPGACAHPEA